MFSKKLKKISSVIFSALFVCVFTSWIGIAHADFKPKAAFDINTTRGSLATEFIVDASRSEDAEGGTRDLDYFWNFGDGTTADGKTARHTYDEADQYIINLTITDKFGITDETSMQVMVRRENILSIFIGTDKSTGTVDDVFNFTAIVVSGIGTPTEQLLTRFDFEGDGIWDTPFSTNHAVQHAYESPGQYAVTAQVVDIDDKMATRIGLRKITGGQLDLTEITRVFVYPSTDLQAGFSVYPTEGDTRTIFHFDAKASRATGSPLLYRFDFDDDGVFEIPWTSDPIQEYHYNIEGLKTVNLQIKNENGVVDETSQTILVTGSRIAPEIRVSIYGDSGSVRDKLVYGTTASSFRYNVIVNDDDGIDRDLLVRMDYDGDGQFDTVWSRERTFYHRYFDPGIYSFHAQVRDVDNNISDYYQDVAVEVGYAPSASIEVAPARGTTDTVFHFRALVDNETSSRNLVRFDFDSDSVFETDFSAQLSETHKYHTLGKKIVTLEVMNSDQQVTRYTTSVVVGRSKKFKVELVADPAVGTYATRFKFTPKDPAKDWSYSWTFSDDDALQLISKTVSKRYKTVGEKSVYLTVTDSEGNVGFSEASVYVHWASPYLRKLRMKGVDLEKFNPFENTTRMQFLRSVIKTKGISLTHDKVASVFNDTNRLKFVDKEILAVALRKQIISDKNRSFYPNNPISRAEALKIIIEAYGLKDKGSPREVEQKFSDVAVNMWPAPYVEVGTNLGIVRGYEDGTFKPWRFVSNGETAKMVIKAQDL